MNLDSELKILRIVPTFFPYVSGVSNQVYWISYHLEKVGISSPIYTTTQNAPNSPLNEIMSNIPVHRFPYKLKFMGYTYTPKMKKAILQEKFTIIHAHNYRNHQAHIGYSIAKKRKIPFFISVHGALLNYQTFLEGLKLLPYRTYDFFLGRKELDSAEKVIVSSKKEIEDALKFGIPNEKIAVVPMGIHTENYFEPNKELKDKETLELLFVGRISAPRNLEPILEAMSLVDNVHITIVGGETKHSEALKPYLPKLYQIVKDKNLQKKVTFVGEKYDKALINEYQKADVFVYTSLLENFGQTILEAGATGLPMICTPVGIANDIIQENESGFIVDFHDPQKIAFYLEKLKNKSLRKQFRMKIYENVKNQFHWDNITQQYINLYRNSL